MPLTKISRTEIAKHSPFKGELSGREIDSNFAGSLNAAIKIMQTSLIPQTASLSFFIPTTSILVGSSCCEEAASHPRPRVRKGRFGHWSSSVADHGKLRKPRFPWQPPRPKGRCAHLRWATTACAATGVPRDCLRLHNESGSAPPFVP